MKNNEGCNALTTFLKQCNLEDIPAELTPINLTLFILLLFLFFRRDLLFLCLFTKVSSPVDLEFEVGFSCSCQALKKPDPVHLYGHSCNYN